jgi:hypothetical protein
MAEYAVGEPVWDRPYGDGGTFEAHDLRELGVSDALIARLRAWNEEYERLALTDFRWESGRTEAAWEQAGLDLARALQDELWDVEVRYAHGSGRRDLPVRER